ncbi:hypothetical protein Plhal304r1_c039g0116741 [Plasmopara halstedii]
MTKKKTKEAPTKKDFKRIHYLEPEYTEKLDQLRHDLQESIERTVQINQAFIRELNKTAIESNRIRHVIKIVEEFTNYADVQRNLIDKKISDIVCYELKKKISRKTEEEEVVDYFCQ